MQRSARLSALLLGCLALAACGEFDIKDTLGLNHKGPDAFQVYSRPPLTVPPEFSLQPPGKGPEYSSGSPADVQAHNKILGTADTPASAPSVVGAAAATPTVHYLNSPATGPASTAVPAVSANALPSNGDAQFLSDTGAAKADPNIREEIEKDKENGVVPKKSTPYLLGGKSDADPVVNADKEADRLKQDQTQGKPPTTGETPVITAPDKGILSDIF